MSDTEDASRNGRCCIDFARLRAKHKKFAETTNRMMTELHRENAALREELQRLTTDDSSEGG